MPTEIIMPQLGESVVDGTVGEWLKQVGDIIEEFEPIVRVSTDKVDTEIPAPASGVLLEIHVQEGDTVDSGVVLGLIGDANEAEATEATPQPSQDFATSTEQAAQAIHAPNGKHRTQAQPTRQPAAQTQTASGGKQTSHITPVVARMVAEHNVDLSQIEGSGRNGRITKKDVLAYLERQDDQTAQADIPPWEQPVDGDLFNPTVEYTLDDAPATPASKPAKSPTSATPKPAQPPAARQQPAPARQPAPNDIPGELITLTNMRKAIAQHMVESKLHIAPHVTTVFEVDLSAVVAHRQANKDAFAKQNVKLTFTPYFVMACVAALREYPMVNARWTDEGIYVHHVAHIGMAVAIDDGLIVPVIKQAQDYNLMGLARHVNDLAERARNKRLQPDEVRGGTFTITNHGVTGGLMATPIINQPQSAIMGVGAIEKRVKVVNDSIAIRPCAYFSLTFDHRIIDGATGENFMSVVKRTLENWS